MAVRVASVRVTGLRETIRRFESLGVEVQDLKDAFRKISNEIVAVARAYVPVRSGALEASIRPSNTKNKSVVRAGGARVPYAGPIHWGWEKRGISANPFLKSASDSNPGKWADMLDDEITALIKKYQLNP